MLKEDELEIDRNIVDEKEEGGNQDAATKKKSKQQLLFELRLKQNECRKRNHGAVVEEDKRVNGIAGKRERDETPAARNAGGKPKEEVDILETITAEQAEERDRKRNRKKKESFGWEMFNEEAHFNSYERSVGLIKQDVKAEYESQVAKMKGGGEVGEEMDMYGKSATPSKEGVERMVEELQKAEDRRAKFSRRRATNPSEDISYINERNKVFNKKIARAFDQYTAEIRQNLERGTAL